MASLCGAFSWGLSIFMIYSGIAGTYSSPTWFIRYDALSNVIIWLFKTTTYNNTIILTIHFILLYLACRKTRMGGIRAIWYLWWYCRLAGGKLFSAHPGRVYGQRKTQNGQSRCGWFVFVRRQGSIRWPACYPKCASVQRFAERWLGNWKLYSFAMPTPPTISRIFQLLLCLGLRNTLWVTRSSWPRRPQSILNGHAFEFVPYPWCRHQIRTRVDAVMSSVALHHVFDLDKRVVLKGDRSSTQ